jgi:hypothetical protein
MASGKMHVRAIGDGGMSGRHHWWTCGVALDTEVQGINGRKNMDDFTV